jgi:hypothetical protein
MLSTSSGLAAAAATDHENVELKNVGLQQRAGRFVHKEAGRRQHAVAVRSEIRSCSARRPACSP